MYKYNANEYKTQKNLPCDVLYQLFLCRLGNKGMTTQEMLKILILDF